MPIVTAPHVRRPYVGKRYDSDGLVRLADLGLQSGRMRANAELRRGEASANAWQAVGQGISRGLGAIREDQERRPILEAQARRLAYDEQQMARGEQQYQEAQAAKAADAAKVAAVEQLFQQYGGLPPEPELIKAAGAQDAMHITKAWQDSRPKPEKTPTREIKRRNADNSETIEIVEDRPGQSFTSAPPVEKPAAPPAVGSFEDYVVRRFGAQPTADQVAQARKTYQQADDRPIRIDNGPKGLTPNMESQVIGRLAKQWNEASKPARELQRQVKLMDVGLEAAKRGDLAQGGQTVLVTFQKILDPPSVVRESEYNRSAAGQSMINRVRGAYDRLVKGGPGVTYQELEKFAQLAREASEAQQGGYLPSVRSRLGKTAARYQIPEELVFEAVESDDAPPVAPAAPGQRKNPFQ